MADAWELFKQFWGLADDESPITDGSKANDFLVEDAIAGFQKSSKEITDITVALSAARADVDAKLQKLREAVTLSYSYALDGRTDDIKKTLEKVLEV